MLMIVQITRNNIKLTDVQQIIKGLLEAVVMAKKNPGQPNNLLDMFRTSNTQLTGPN